MKCVVALALAFTAQAVDVDWRIPGGNQLPPVTVDPAADGAADETITFKWNGFHNVYEMPSEAAMNACDFSGAQELSPSSSGGSVTVDAPAAGETKYYACEVGSHCNAGQRVAITSEGAPVDPTPGAPTMNIVETAQDTDILSTLVQAVVAADLVDTLSGPGPFTVFAPTNEAFAALPEGTLESLLEPENKEQLVKILTYHVVSGKVLSTDLTESDVPTVQGSDVKVTVDPPAINGANVVLADVLATNGVVHVIDAVLIPPEEATDDAPVATDDAPGSIVDIAAGDERFTTLVAALKAAGLVDALSGDGPFTVFAPTDDAFAALPAGTVESLLLPENLTTLQDILKYHVVPAKVLSTDLSLNQKAPTLEGSDVTVTSLDPVKINESEVIQADVMASNGVIHVISSVLMPPSDDEPTKGPTAMEESDSAGRASLAVAAAAAVAYVL